MNMVMKKFLLTNVSYLKIKTRKEGSDIVYNY